MTRTSVEWRITILNIKDLNVFDSVFKQFFVICLCCSSVEIDIEDDSDGEYINMNFSEVSKARGVKFGHLCFEM